MRFSLQKNMGVTIRRRPLFRYMGKLIRYKPADFWANGFFHI